MYPADQDNPWMAAVRAGRPLLPAWAAALAAMALATGVVFGGRVLGSRAAGSILSSMTHVPAPWPGVVASLVFRLIVYAPLAIIAVGACLADRRSPWLSGAKPGLAAPFGVLVSAGGFALAVALAALAGDVGAAPVQLSGAAGIAAIVSGVVLFALQCTAEELYFRGWLQPLLCARWGASAGVLVTALLFAGLHLAGGARAPVSLINLFLGGLLFGLLALRTGGLWAPVLAHFAWNWSEAVGAGLEANPDLGPTGSILHLALRGDPIWSGGEDHLNGSIAMTLVLAALVIGMMAFGVSRSATPASRRSGSVP
jgi:membrane protease YdiL (CAAX protease family)